MIKVSFFDFGPFDVPADGQTKSYDLPDNGGELNLMRNKERLTFNYNNDDDSKLISGRARFVFQAEFDDLAGKLKLKTFVRGSSQYSLNLLIPNRSSWFLDRNNSTCKILDQDSSVFDMVIEQDQFNLDIPGFVSESEISVTDRFRWELGNDDFDSFRLKTDHYNKCWSWVRIGEMDIRKSDAKWIDYYEVPEEEGSVIQNLNLRSIKFNDDPNVITSVELSFKPCHENGLLHISPESLSQNGVDANSNPIIYSQSLANGTLKFAAENDQWSGGNKLLSRWSQDDEIPERKQLLMFNNLQDENSLQVPFELTGDLDLEERAGLGGSIDLQGEKAAGGLILTGKPSGSANEPNATIKGKVQCLKLDHDKEEITFKYHERNGIETLPQPPREIHGPFLNSFLKRDDNISQQDIDDEIIVENIEYPLDPGDGASPLAKTNKLHLSSKKYSITTVFEEEEYGPNGIPGTTQPVKRVGTRELFDKNQTLSQDNPLEIPATDIRYAVANMVDTEIAKKSHERYRQLDLNLVEKYRAFQPNEDTQDHTANFKLKSNAKKGIGIESVLGRMNSIAENFKETDIEPVQQRETPHTFAFGKGNRLKGNKDNVNLDSKFLDGLSEIKVVFDIVSRFWDRSEHLQLPAAIEAEIKKILDVVDADNELIRNKLHDLRENLLDNIESKTDPTSYIKQVLVTLTKLKTETFNPPLHIDNLKLSLLADPQKVEDLWEKVRTKLHNDLTKDEKQYKQFFILIQSVLQGWKTWKFKANSLTKFKPVYQRLALGVARLQTASEKLNYDKEYKVDWNKLKSILQESKKDLVEVTFKKAWNDIDNAPAPFNEIKKIKKALLWTVPPSKEITQRFVQQIIKLQSLDEKSAIFRSNSAILKKLGANIDARLRSALDQHYENIKLPEFDTLLNQGVDENLESLKDIWENSADDIIKELREDYKIPAYNKDVYERLIKESTNRLDEVARLIGKKELTKLQKEWRLETDATIKQLKAKYGDELSNYSDQVYRKVLKESVAIKKKIAKLIGIKNEQVEELEKLKTLGENAGELLRSLKTEPPEYLLISDRIHVEYGPAQKKQIAQLKEMFNRKFGLASIGNNFWDFQLSEDSTYIIKLTGAKTLQDLLIEIQTSFEEDNGDGDPLGLWDKTLEDIYSTTNGGQSLLTLLNNGDKGAAKVLVQLWVDHYLDEDLKAKSWRGVITFNSTIDLEGDQITRELCGLRFLTAKYIAIQGGHLSFKVKGKTEPRETLNVFATIFTQKEMEVRSAEDRDQTHGNTDSGVALTKFDVRIRNTEVRADSRIELQLNLERLFGRDISDADNDYVDDGRYGFAKDGFKNYENIKIIGSKSEEQGENKLEFAAIFPSPREIPIDLACIKSVVLSGIKASIFNGRTVLDIDAKINLQDFRIKELGDVSFDIIKGSTIKLKEFRLVFPDLDKAADKAIGAIRNMMFDFNSISFELSKPRTIRLGQIDLTFLEIGYARLINKIGSGIKPETAYGDLKRRFTPIIGASFDEVKESGFPYIVFDVDFGKFPSFMGNSLGNLKLSLMFGLIKTKNANGSGSKFSISYQPVVGLGGLYAKDISFDFFRVLTIKIAELYLQNEVPSTLSPYTDQKYTVIGAENIRLSMLDVDLIGSTTGDPTKNRGLDFLMLQDQLSRRALLFTLFNKADEDSFVRIHWVLLGKNIAVDPNVLNYLLQDTGDSPNSAMSELVVRKKEDTKAWKVKSIKAGITGNDEWLFGISFGLGELVDKGKLIFHDDHYYGISLRSDWLEVLTGLEALTLAYIPGPTSSQDKFFVEFPLSFLELFGPMRAGWLTAYWAFNTDFLFSLGFPFRRGAQYLWERSFSIAAGYEFQFGFYIEKKTVKTLKGDEISLGGGLAIAIGLGIALGNRMLYVRAGIGIFVIVEGYLIILKKHKKLSLAIVGFSFTGVIGILAYVEGGINIWIISARFRAELQAALSGTITYHRDRQPLLLSYNATLYAGYHASARIKIGFVKITFTVSGRYPIQVKGQHLID